MDYERQSYPGVLSPVIEGIKANAEAAIEELGHLTDFAFGYNRESVEWLEGCIERMKAAGVFDGPNADKLVSVCGSFLGECIARCHGGTWKIRNGSWGIVFDDENVALPFAAVLLQVRDGKGRGIRSFFDRVPITFIGCLAGSTGPASRSTESVLRKQRV